MNEDLATVSLINSNDRAVLQENMLQIKPIPDAAISD